MADDPTQPIPFDQLPPARQAAIKANVAKLYAAKLPEDQINDYLVNHEHVGPPTLGHGAELHSEFAAGTLAPRIASENAQDATLSSADADPAVGSKTLGVIAALNRDIPGAEAAQAKIRSLIRRQPYSEALGDIRGAENAAPAAATVPARFAGGALATAALPGGAAVKGATYGALLPAAQADPNAGLAQRGGEAVTGAVAGGLLGRYAGKVASKLGVSGNAIASRLSAANESAPLDAVRSAVGMQPKNVLRAVGSFDVLPEAADEASAPATTTATQTAARSVAAPVVKPASAPPPSNLTSVLEGQLAKLRAVRPGGPGGNVWSDAEIAQGLDQPEPDLAALLRRSIVAQGGTPVDTGLPADAAVNAGQQGSVLRLLQRPTP